MRTDPAEPEPTGPLERFQQRVESYNAAGERPYALGYSVGAIVFDPRRHGSVDDLLREADECMYSQKRSKKCVG